MDRDLVARISQRIEFQEPIPPSEDEHKMLNALFGYKASLKDSAFFITPAPPSPDIQRYSDQFKKKKAQHSLRDVKTDLAFFPHELHIVKDDSIIVTVSTDANQKKVQFDLDLTFGQLLEQESKEKAKNVEHGNENEFEKYPDMEQIQEDEEYGDATDYVESYFDNGETDDAFDDDGGKIIFLEVEEKHILTKHWKSLLKIIIELLKNNQKKGKKYLNIS
ncbi:hypothetical protein RirG_245130 [Rhizophagus irregularis DAOM 197198w]|uniref:DNA-directed RNA polymerase III subunit n=1 Tax=Rhizophagus irregularis (strain DAOM 197198w) TaxID=1432141 RepID=A0A015IH14_RHIIW|nr:hypothetical protein RirG_245130 [Rhizophagus irregularis DAOM 197198w]